MMNRLFASAVAAFLIAFDVSSGRAQDSPAPRWVAPSEADTLKNPLSQQPQIIAGGKKIFEQRCSMCHAADGTGTNRGPNLTIQHVQNESDGALFWKISSGNTRSGMPTFSYVPAPQRWQLVMYVRSLGE